MDNRHVVVQEKRGLERETLLKVLEDPACVMVKMRTGSMRLMLEMPNDLADSMKYETINSEDLESGDIVGFMSGKISHATVAMEKMCLFFSTLIGLFFPTGKKMKRHWRSTASNKGHRARWALGNLRRSSSSKHASLL